MKETFHGSFTEHSMLKRGKSWKNFSPEILEPRSRVKPAKREDIFGLLKEVGAPTSVKDYYNAILAVDAGDQSDTD